MANGSAELRALDGAGVRRSSRTLVEDVYRRLKSDIIYGLIKPGTKLRVEALRARFGVSSSTMREALLLLVGDSLASAEGQRGFRVTPVSMADFAEVTRLRKLMESMALRESIELGDEAWEARVVAAFHTLGRIDIRKMRSSPDVAREWNLRNNAFHEALMAASPSHWVQHFRHILYQHAERYRTQQLLYANVRPTIRQEHKGIMDAALARDADLACELNEKHIDRTYFMLVELHARGKTDFTD